MLIASRASLECRDEADDSVVSPARYHPTLQQKTCNEEGLWCVVLSTIQRFQARGESTIVPGSVAEARTSTASLITPL